MKRSRQSRKRSEHELKRLVEQAVADVCELSTGGLAFQVNAIEAQGRPSGRLQVWATLHFLPSGSPFCCDEPQCHLSLHGNRLEHIADVVRRAMGLAQPVVLDFSDRIAVQYHDGVEFRQDTG